MYARVRFAGTMLGMGLAAMQAPAPRGARKAQSEMNHRFFQAGATLAGAAVIAAAMATIPAIANGNKLHAHPAKVVTCNSKQYCTGGANSGSGGGVQASNTGLGDGMDATSQNNNAVTGFTFNPSKTKTAASGVYGVDASTDKGLGNVGVTGVSGYGTGVRGQSTFGQGVVGWSNDSAGVEALSFSQSAAIVGVGGTANDSNGMSLATYDNNGISAFYVTNDRNAHVNGLLYTLGSCSKGCDPVRGDRVASYAAQTSVPMLEDVGEGRLAGGQARIAIDASLARAIDQGAPYVVFVTPEGQSHGLYVTNKTRAGFTVAENDGGRSSIPFGYRIVAKPYGVNAARLPVITAANMPHSLKVERPTPAR